MTERRKVSVFEAAAWAVGMAAWSVFLVWVAGQLFRAGG